MAPEMSAVTISQFRVFTSEIECLRDRTAREQLHGLTVKDFHAFGRIEALSMQVELLGQANSVVSIRVFTGIEGLTMRTNGLCATIATGVKSVVGSNGRLL